MSDIVAILTCSAISMTFMVLAFKAGQNAGYWKRMQEEKDAKGIR